ncbi:hypothetical protein TRFO_38517 [Tritrichomonas foetus]|uniref:Uncharacterized protein n=1 Tax=Tritrichomonas foetus TaxID=1144522 RepID=A0A1J4JCH5_9EUKA|nr:hypothetical protein TRFO_38517 [Tritrichomonas foetus]|eukprot:OHS95355.1 hypothetical protein TRFO_38517 [Tritrichomonas foetus]
MNQTLTNLYSKYIERRETAIALLSSVSEEFYYYHKYLVVKTKMKQDLSDEFVQHFEICKEILNEKWENNDSKDIRLFITNIHKLKCSLQRMSKLCQTIYYGAILLPHEDTKSSFNKTENRDMKAKFLFIRFFSLFDVTAEFNIFEKFNVDPESVKFEKVFDEEAHE